ncbi:paralemmin-3 [Nerophis ophidion]|uniref:paralemmin-3 n=1 Tax=Nerophis ophidion TaxID=159077 RepID=UPI002ADFDF50|nr:paralemmin-3 [Nerophis ophidion]XP_061766316.1 paralemmin-3 [Nerophis ophidion]XP_061766324.1 paralemmin-3 [Nerophis ophidion]XP_061766333.1 paralemmin-3 [Nerophis ophidion]
MDEAQKYKHRLEAIAEKRRLQEEQERAKRDMEDEKLRVQQLKRKSLRDQWLMEGAPLSPSSLDSQSPRTPPWASPEVGENRSHGVQVSEGDEEEEIAVGQTEAVEMEEEGVEMMRGAVLQNRDNNNMERSGKVEGDVKACQISARDEDATVNGQGDLKEGDLGPHDEALELWNSQAGTTNGPSEEVLVDISTELDEGVVVMRAERVIILDDDEEEELEETAQTTTEWSGETVEEMEGGLEASVESVEIEANAGQQSGTEGDDGEYETQAQDNEIKVEASVVVTQSPVIPLEGATVAPVPEYAQSEAPQAEGETPAEEATPEEADTSSLKAPEECFDSQFHEVPLSDTLENHRTEAEPGEQEPLLEEVQAANVHKAEVAESRPAGAHTPGDAMEAPKKKSCQCCSVM